MSEGIYEISTGKPVEPEETTELFDGYTKLLNNLEEEKSW
tara:strand:- start:507 stop:626 length:120 start_codon:yes stop_codon:yes gene_type:complete